MRRTSTVVLAVALAAAGCRAIRDLYAAQQAVQQRFGQTYVYLKNDTLRLTLRSRTLAALEPAAQHDTALAAAGVALDRLTGDPVSRITIIFQPKHAPGGSRVTSYSWALDELRADQAAPPPTR